MKHLLLIFILLPFYINAQEFPVKPLNYITDKADVLSDHEEQLLNAKLHNFKDSTSNQLFVYIANSLNGNDIESYSQQIFKSWQIGQEGKNNGILITIFVNDHKFRIHTGYGLEGALPDLLTRHIQDNDMRPLFKENNYYGGIDKGVDQLMYYSSHEFNPDDVSESHLGLFLFFYGFSAVFLIITLILATGIKDKPTAKKVLIILSILFFLIPFLGSFLLLILLFVSLSYRKEFLKTPGSSNNWEPQSSYFTSSSGSDSSSSSDSGFDGGGGGDSGGGGSSSDW